MNRPERRERGPAEGPVTPVERGRITRAAVLRPINLLMLAIGAFAFVLTAQWWIAPLTIVTYAALVLLSARDPGFERRVPHGGEHAARTSGVYRHRDVSPERRARWLPRGETRERVEVALVVYRKVIAAIEESDDVTRAVLDDAIPKLHAAADRLVDVAEVRERAADTISELRQKGGAVSPARDVSLRDLEETLHEADAEISDTFEKLLTMRAQTVQVSLAGESRNQAAATLNASLDDLNSRLEALSEIMSPPESTYDER
jgi:hypothetical protein